MHPEWWIVNQYWSAGMAQIDNIKYFMSSMTRTLRQHRFQSHKQYDIDYTDYSTLFI